MKKIVVLATMIVALILMHTVENEPLYKGNKYYEEDYKTINSLTDEGRLNFTLEHSDVATVAAGMRHTVMATTSGKIYAFGSNYHHNLGSGYDFGDIERVEYSQFPMLVTNNLDADMDGIPDLDGGFVNDGSDKVIAVSAGERHTVMLTESGKVYTFGYSSEGQLGNENAYLEFRPIAVSSGGGFVNGGSDKVIAVSAGFSHTVMLTESGKVYTFGYNNFGQLGNGQLGDLRNSEISIPLAVVSGEDFINDGSDKVIAVSAGEYHTVMLTESGKVYAFGDNSVGQLGNGNDYSDKNGDGRIDYSDKYESAPVLVSSGEDFVNDGSDKVITVAAGGDCTLITTESGKVYAFGSNSRGQLGNDKNPDDYSDTNGDGIIDRRDEYESTPVLISSGEGFVNDGSDKVIAAAIGLNHTLITTESGKAYAFGDNSAGQLGNGKSQIDYEDINGDGYIGYIDMFEKSPVLVGNNLDADMDGILDLDGGFVNNGNDKIIEVTAGHEYTLIVLESGKVYSFGKNSSGQLGNGKNLNSNIPVRIKKDFSFSLLGRAITHNKKITTKYNSDVVIKDITNEAKVEISNDNGENYIDVTSSFNNGEYTFGNNNSVIAVNINEETKLKIKVTSLTIENSGTIEYTFIIDKKPPQLNNSTNICNLVDDMYYCNQDFDVELLNDLSGFYGDIKKVENEVEAYFTITLDNVIENLVFNELEERATIEYTITDGAGNQALVKIIMDNYSPRIELK